MRRVLIAILAFAGIWMPCVAQNIDSGGLHEVVVTGRGATDDEALLAAFVVALERTVGTIIHSATVSQDFQIQSDVQMLLTNGCIDSYDELSSSTSDGVVSKTIRARVRRGMVADWMRRSGWSGPADLNDTWARLATSIRGRRQALEMLHQKMPAIRDALYTAALVDPSTGSEVSPSSRVPAPFTQENLDGDVLCVWPAVLRPDFEFWDNHAAPLLAACFETLCEKKARLFVNMTSGAPALASSMQRVPMGRWQRVNVHAPPPWLNGRPVKAPSHAPHCIALENRSVHRESLDLALYFFTDEVYNRIMNPPEVIDGEGNVVSRPERFRSIRAGLNATLVFSDGSESLFSMEQPSPLFQTMDLPWSGGVSAAYCGPYFFPTLYRGGWQDTSRWPNWQGPIKPQARVPGFGNFVIAAGKVHSAEGDYMLAFENLGKPTGYFPSAPYFDWRTVEEVIVPVSFTLGLDQLRRIRHLRIEPVTGAPPLQPGMGEGIKRLFKALFN